MNKTWTFLSLTIALAANPSFGGTIGETYFDEYSPWNGFYIGANAGYLWSANNLIHDRGTVTFENPLFLPNSQEVARSLAVLGTNSYKNSSRGFLGGGQIGYNSQILDRLVIGIDTDIDAIAHPNTTTTITKSVSTPLQGIHTANITQTRKLNYLGLLKGRLGYLISPRMLIYGAGAFAYGGASLDTTYSVTGSQPQFLPVNVQRSTSKVLAGFAVGAGGEWMFNPCWSMKLEYIYYSLGALHNNGILDQYINNPPARFAASTVESEAVFTENTVRVGINYHI